MQLHLVLLDEGNEDAEEQNLEADIEEAPRISLHAIAGTDHSEAMRIVGHVGKGSIQVLIDSGSTHDFLDLKTAQKLGWQSQNAPFTSVQVAGGRSLKVHGVWNGFRWKMQGMDFVFDFRIIELCTYDMVLGLKWLKSLKNALWDYESLSMYFWREGQLCKLQANVPNTWSIMPQKGVDLGSFREDQLYLLQLVKFEDKEVECFMIQQETEGISPEIQSVLESFQEVFGEPQGLPPLRDGHNHPIVLEEGTNPISLKPYRYPAAQKDVIEKLVAELQQTGLIQESASPFSAPIVFVKKKNGTWRMCVDYRELNKKTVKNQYPIPLVEDLFDELSKARWFTKLDLKAGYHQIRMVPEDSYKTAFKTHSGHYEWLVMPFGLTNAPATFQGAMNDIFRPYLRKFILVFFDDILIYSPTLLDHKAHLQIAFEILLQNQFFVKKSKCTFAARKVEYLGHVIGDGGVATDPKKIQVVADWPQPSSVKQLRAFLGLAGYYRRFIKNYGSIAKPLTQLLRKNGFQWTEAATHAFQQLKHTLISAPVLALPDFSQEFVVETDACGNGVGAVLMQGGQPLAFFSKALAPRHHNLSIYEKELMAVVMAVLHWHQYLERGKFVIRTDQQSLKYLMGQQLETSFQMFWIVKLAGFDFEIVYKKRADNSVVDSLSRLPKQ